MKDNLFILTAKDGNYLMRTLSLEQIKAVPELRNKICFLWVRVLPILGVLIPPVLIIDRVANYGLYAGEGFLGVINCVGLTILACGICWLCGVVISTLFVKGGFGTASLIPYAKMMQRQPKVIFRLPGDYGYAEMIREINTSEKEMSDIKVLNIAGDLSKLPQPRFEQIGVRTILKDGYGQYVIDGFNK